MSKINEYEKSMNELKWMKIEKYIKRKRVKIKENKESLEINKHEKQ